MAQALEPNALARALMSGQFPVDQLPMLDHATLYQARQYLPAQFQSLIAPAEHQAFAREATQENPLLAIPIAAGALAYQPYKWLMGQSRSAPSLDQVGAGLTGVGQGIGNRLTALLSNSN